MDSIGRSRSTPKRTMSMSRSGSVRRRAPTNDGLQELPFSVSDRGGMRAVVVEGPGIFYMGIIDILQQWDWRKRGERLAKVHLSRADPKGLSAIEPGLYQRRFLQAMTDQVIAEREAWQMESNGEVCGECEQAPAEWNCGDCGDSFCTDCYELVHAKRRNLEHVVPTSCQAVEDAELQIN